MDWKVRKNMAAGLGERGTEILHFRRAFHGRSGYTMSLTNTDPRKTDLFAKFNWPRVSSPSLDFSLPESERERDVIEREKKSEVEIRKFIHERGTDIAAIIIEPIQGEGGDNHFRGEWLRKLRTICDESDILLIFDEVQTGLTTGQAWCCQHFDVKPDLLAFGKKVQACGVMAGPRFDEVKDNAFCLPSRLNSTWGGNLTDMVHRTRKSFRKCGQGGCIFPSAIAWTAAGMSSHLVGARSRAVYCFRFAGCENARSSLARIVRCRAAGFEIRRAFDSFPSCA